MPLFGGFINKFSPKRAPIRKNLHQNVNNLEELKDLVVNQREIPLELSDQRLIFENGEWIPASGHANSTIYRSNQKLKKRIEDLQEENNLLRVKCSIMLKMLTQSTAECHLLEKQLQKTTK